MSRFIRFGKDVVNGWLGADAFTLAAALAYYAIFAIAPLLLISIYLASLLLVSLVLSTAMTAFAGTFANALGLPSWTVAAVIAVGNFLLSVLILTAIFKFVPSVEVTWRAAAAGGTFTAILFALGRFALAWYLGRQAEASVYGAATSLVLLLVWVYYSAQILFLGAQFSQTVQESMGRTASRSRTQVTTKQIGTARYNT